MDRIVDIALWVSRRLRLAALALICVFAVKTAATALDTEPPGADAQALIKAAMLSQIGDNRARLTAS